MKHRVLILSTSAGSGHKSAAAALEKVFARSPQVDELLNIDALERTNELYRAFYSDLYLHLVQERPYLLGWWYQASDEPWKTDAFRLLLDRINADPLSRLIREFAPTITVCTHFMPAGIVAQLLADGAINTHLAIVTTDYDFHSMWLSPRFNRYFVALEETKVHLMALGLPEERITVSGIPVDPVFEEPIDRDEVLARYHLDPDLPILLLSAGAAGVGPAREAVQQILQMRTPSQVIIVCGRNEELRNELVDLVAPQAKRFRVLGFTSEMPALMKISTILIGKPGGLTSSEAMAAGLPMVIIAPIPGQEERNSDHLLEEGVALRCNQMTTLAYKIDRLLENPERLARMRENTRAIGRPDAARVIVETLLNEEADEPVTLQESTPPIRVLPLRINIADLFSPPLKDDEWFTIADAQSDEPLGVVTGAEMRVLFNNLEIESAEDTDFYINQDTLALLAERGASAMLLDILRRALGDRSECDVRWRRGREGVM
ncbi:MGDG synthase family glycosyltransferase [Roseiflexus sp.]|uniref:MGDG synthase family glycosyltransferase n=1 Tax=Roseiflexus sp. TaxID=2562120 RepID=UPI00398ACE17